MAGRRTIEHLGELHDSGQFARLVDLDPSWQEALDRLAELARRTLRVPLAQINVIQGDQQRSLSSVSAGPEWEEWSGPRSVPVESTYCQHVIRSGEPLVVGDSLLHPLLKENPATTEAGVRSYAAVPLKNAEGVPLATLCVVDFSARDWDSSDLDALAALADLLIREVRGRFQAEEALQQGEARFRSLIENGQDLITVLDSAGNIRYQSPAYERTLGYGNGSLLGTDFASLVHPDGVERWRTAFFDPLTRPEGSASAEWRMRHEDGSWRTVRGLGSNLLHDPAVRGLVLNIYDKTDQRQLEAELHQAQKMEAVGRLAGGVAHDFNNLLTAIRGNTEFLLSHPDLPRDAEVDIQEISRTAQRATELTRQLLTFSRAQVLELKALDLGALAEETVALVKRLAGVNVTLETSFERGLIIEADEGQLSQVIMNLAVNARDAMPGGGTLRLEASEFTATDEYALSHSDMKAGRYAMLVVADDGAGMTRDVQSRIFEPFFTTKESGQGTGLGLSICWGIVRQVGGHIHLYSEPGRGTTFRVYFPRADPTEEIRTSGLDVEEASPPVALGTILVVEDQPEVRRVIQRTLCKDGHSVVEAGTAEEALSLARELGAGLDLLLTDVLLPGMNGSELARRLAEDRPGLPTIFTSGFTRGELEDQRADMGSAAFLPKPFGPEELVQAVRRALSGRIAMDGQDLSEVSTGPAEALG